MAPENTKDFKELRVKTDNSLDAERHKTDAVIDRKSKSIEKDSDKKIRQKRIEADKNQVKERDGKPELADVADERQRSDEAQLRARHEEDRVRADERNQKRMVAETLLANERSNTDGKLSNERDQVDQLSSETSNLLTKEQTSHDVTKTALITRDQFLAIVSHDLKDPLGAITMSASLMRMALNKSDEKNSEFSQLLEVVEQSASNMDRMISDLLDVERMSSGKLDLQKKPTEICALLNECVDHFTPIAKSKGFSLSVQICEAPVMVNIDHDRILQVMSNLIGNALKFCDAGAEIQLSAIRDTNDNKNEIKISVTDNGPGIEEEKKSHIFERFSQLKINDRRGLGLGLFISKWIVEAHEGRIWVTSEVGCGSTFHYTLPISLTQKESGEDGV